MKINIFSIKKQLKAYKWWHYKIPPLLGMAYYLMAVSHLSIPLSLGLPTIGMFLVALVGLAGFGHVVNDLFDIKPDKIVGKYNAMEGLTTAQRLLALFLLLVASWAPWLYLPTNGLTLALVSLELLLFLLYSAPPIRLKERGILGILADALYGYTVPFLFTWTTFNQLGLNQPITWLMLCLCLWSLCAGVRGILHSQVRDVENDVRTGVSTFVTQHGIDKTLWIISRVVIPAEMVLFIVFAGLLSFEVSFFLIGFGIYVSWKYFNIKYMWRETFNSIQHLTTQQLIRYSDVFLNEFYEKWLPLFMLAALIIKEPIYLALAMLHLMLFKDGLSEFLWHDLRHIPSAITKMRQQTV